MPRKRNKELEKLRLLVDFKRSKQTDKDRKSPKKRHQPPSEKSKAAFNIDTQDTKGNCKDNVISFSNKRNEKVQSVDKEPVTESPSPSKKTKVSEEKDTTYLRNSKNTHARSMGKLTSSKRTEETLHRNFTHEIEKNKKGNTMKISDNGKRKLEGNKFAGDDNTIKMMRQDRKKEIVEQGLDSKVELFEIHKTTEQQDTTEVEKDNSGLKLKKKSKKHKRKLKGSTHKDMKECDTKTVTTDRDIFPDKSQTSSASQDKYTDETNDSTTPFVFSDINKKENVHNMYSQATVIERETENVTQRAETDNQGKAKQKLKKKKIKHKKKKDAKDKEMERHGKDMFATDKASDKDETLETSENIWKQSLKKHESNNSTTTASPAVGQEILGKKERESKVECTESELSHKYKGKTKKKRNKKREDKNSSTVNENVTDHSKKKVHTEDGTKTYVPETDNMGKLTQEHCDDMSDKERTIEFEIDESTWKTISPQTKIFSNGRKVRRLSNNWTDVFSEKVNDLYPGCVLAFKYHYVTSENSRKSHSAVIKADAYCKGNLCLGKFSFTMTSEYINESAHVSCHVSGHISHNSEETNRRNITGKKRQQTGEKNKHAAELFYENLLSGPSEQLEKGNYTSVPTLNVLRKIISEQIKKEHMHTDVIRELQILKEAYEGSGQPYIREISLDPFTLIMISDEQINFMKNRKLSLYIDATGSIISKVGGQKRPFLYSVVAKPNELLPEISLGDMITTQHNIPKLEYFLNVIKREVSLKGATFTVSKVETDYSLAIIQACQKAFNSCSLKDYLNVCSDIVMKSRDIQNVTVHHLCSSHMLQDFIRTMKRECPRLSKSKREMAIRLFALLQNTSSLSDAKRIYQNICFIFLSPYETSAVQEAMESINKAKQETPVFAELSDEDDDEEELTVDSTVEGKTISESSPFTAVFETVKETVQRQLDESSNKNAKCTYNAMYIPDVVRCFVKFMPIYPLWSGIMLSKLSDTEMKERTRDTNSSVEAWFKVIKNDVGIGLRSRPARFVIGLRKLVHGRLREQMFPRAKQPKTRRKKTVDQKMEVAEEKWKKKSKKRKPKYQPVDVKPTKTSKKQRFPAVMSWGGQYSEVSLSNTCTIDNGLTILHLFYSEREEFRKVLKSDTSDLSQTLLSVFKLMDEENFAEAKLVWINYVREDTLKETPGKTSLLANLYGDEIDFFVNAIESKWVSKQTSRCQSNTCANKEYNVEHGIGRGISGEVTSVQDILDLWLKNTHPCASENVHGIDASDQETGDGCTEERTVTRNILEFSPIAAIRLYEHALFQRISLKQILKSKSIQISGHTYILAGVTMHRNAHYCAVVLFQDNYLWYDGLAGNLKSLPRSLEQWFPSHAIYCQV